MTCPWEVLPQYCFGASCLVSVLLLHTWTAQPIASRWAPKMSSIQFEQGYPTEPHIRHFSMLFQLLRHLLPACVYLKCFAAVLRWRYLRCFECLCYFMVEGRRLRSVAYQDSVEDKPMGFGRWSVLCPQGVILHTWGHRVGFISSFTVRHKLGCVSLE